MLLLRRGKSCILHASLFVKNVKLRISLFMHKPSSCLFNSVHQKQGIKTILSVLLWILSVFSVFVWWNGTHYVICKNEYILYSMPSIQVCNRPTENTLPTSTKEYKYVSSPSWTTFLTSRWVPFRSWTDAILYLINQLLEFIACTKNIIKIPPELNAISKTTIFVPYKVSILFPNSKSMVTQRKT